MSLAKVSIIKKVALCVFLGSLALGFRLPSLDDALQVLIRDDGDYNVLCKDGTLEIISAQDLAINNLCPHLPYNAEDLNILSIDLLTDGTFHVICKDLSEHIATSEQIMSNQVCNESTLPLPNKMDFLFVIDNSASMQTSQQHLMQSMNEFIDILLNNSVDFRVAVTTTDANKQLEHDTAKNCSVFRDGPLDWVRGNVYDCHPIDHAQYSGVRVANNNTPNVRSVLQTNLMQDIYGSGQEQAFQSFEVAINEPKNANFLRNDAYLAIIILSDEDDLSETQGVPTPIDYYVNYLNQLNTSGYSVSSFSIKDQECLSQLQGHTQTIGYRYMELSQATNGYAGSICDPFDWNAIFGTLFNSQ